MIDRKTVEHVAKLARLRLTEQEIEKFTKELSAILDAFSTLQKISADASPSFQPIPLKNVAREDKEEQSLSQDEALANAEHKEEKYFKGPRIV